MGGIRPRVVLVHYSHSINLYRLSQFKRENFCELGILNKMQKIMENRCFLTEKDILQSVGKEKTNLYDVIENPGGSDDGTPG